MVTLTVSSTRDYSGQVFLSAVDKVDFTNAAGTTAIAIFTTGQADGFPLSDTLIVDGSAGLNVLTLRSDGETDYFPRYWTFSSWGTDDYVLHLGSTGNDTMRDSLVNDIFNCGAGNDVIGTLGGRDTVRGGSGNDTVFDSDPLDTPGADVFDGGSGVDELSLVSGQAVVIDLSDGGGGRNIGDGTTIAGFEVLSLNLLAADGGSDVLGGRRRDVLHGSQERETLNGGGGDDYIEGHGGADVLTGGSSGDEFVFDLRESSLLARDVITDFQSGVDVLRIYDSDADIAPVIFRGTEAFAGGLNEVRYYFKAGDTVVALDSDGNRKADMIVLLRGEVTLVAEDITTDI